MPSLSALRPELRAAAEWLLRAGRSYDRRLVVTSVYRSLADQARLYAKWKAGQSRLPVAPPGRSKHQYRLAFDLARPGIDPYSDDLLPELGAAWVAMGGFW